MNKAVVVGVIGVVIIGGGAYLFTSQSTPVVESNADQMGTTSPLREPSADEQKQHEDYVATKATEIKKEQGVTGTAVKATPTPQNSQSPNWVLSVPVNSLGSDIFITADKDGTVWMNNARFDKELTDFETNEKAQLSQTRANWDAIIANSDYSSAMISEIKSNYLPIWQNELQSLQEIQKAAAGITTIFQSRWGVGKGNVPTKYQAAYQWNLDVSLVLDDYIMLVETNIELKNMTIANVQNKNVNSAVMSANDEDRITLVASWFDERLNTLMRSKDQMMEQMNQLIAEYPSN